MRASEKIERGAGTQLHSPTNTIPDFLAFRHDGVVSIERTMLLCGYNTKLTSRSQAPSTPQTSPSLKAQLRWE
jgi:hypothetical protein